MAMALILAFRRICKNITVILSFCKLRSTDSAVSSNKLFFAPASLMSMNMRGMSDNNVK